MRNINYFDQLKDLIDCLETANYCDRKEKKEKYKEELIEKIKKI
ncbi:MAG: hypothetical protein ACQEQF_07040 [Bacillota bacterium]